MKLFNTEEVNIGRQWAFDFTKFIAILSMVAVHTFIYIYGEENMDTGFQYRLNNIYGGVLAAPAFMFAMGVSIAYSRRTDVTIMAQRGAKLIVAGYLLNVMRSLPQLLLWLGGYGEEHYGSFMEELMLFDILQFAGFSFLLFALLQWLKASPTVVLLTGVALSVFGTFVRFVDMGSMWANLLCYPFVGIHVGNIWTNFPMANWFIFVTVGYWLGKQIRRCNDLERFYALVLPVAGFIFTAGMIYLTHRAMGMFGEESNDAFYYLTPLDALICIAGTLLVAGIGHFIMPHEPKVVFDEVKQVANDVTRIYLVHWIFVAYLVGGICEGLYDWDPNQFVPLFLSLAILVVSAWLARRKPCSKIKI